jgi:acetamidase/formamidase
VHHSDRQLLANTQHRRNTGLPTFDRVTSSHRLPATPDTVFWGYFDPEEAPVLQVASGDTVAIEALTHHAGDAPDLMMDDGVRAVWESVTERGPGVHIMTGPISVAGATTGSTLAVTVNTMSPRLAYGSTIAANWGALYADFEEEWITIWELDASGPGSAPEFAVPAFRYDFTGLPMYDQPGFVTIPDPSARHPFSRPVRVPVRPHFGVMGVAPAAPGKVSSIPPDVHGGNVDNWRLGPGATMYYPVFVDGANLFVGDPHLGQGDGEVCGTAIECSLDAELTVSVVTDFEIDAPVLETATHWFTHGFSTDLDEAMRAAVRRLLTLVQQKYGLSRKEAYSLVSVGGDVGVTQVVDGNLGCHAAIPKALFL